MEKQKLMSLGLMVILVIGIVFISGCIKEKPSGVKGGEMTWTPEYPEEYIIYQDYIKTIGGKPRISDIGTIEATVISITNSEACPYSEEKCRIEPYPKDIGIVRIDKIIEYTPYSEQTMEQPVEQPSGKEPLEEGKATPGYEGQEPQKPKLPEYESLQEGQEVPISFLLTAGPIKVRYVSIPLQCEPEPDLDGATESSIEESIEHPITLGEESLSKTYKPIPKEGDYYVFTTKIIEYPEISQKILPGLKEGDKFRAKINYCGTLYVEEYEVIH